MSKSIVLLFLSLWGSVAFAQDELLANCLANYVYVSRGYLYVNSGLALKDIDAKSQAYILPPRESCQRLGLTYGQVQIVDDRRVRFFRLRGNFGEGIIMRFFKPKVQLAVHAQIARSFNESARHPIEIEKFPNLIFTYQVNFQKNLYMESISYGQKWESESD
jgi:hypothetical protein